MWLIDRRWLQVFWWPHGVMVEAWIGRLYLSLRWALGNRLFVVIWEPAESSLIRHLDEDGSSCIMPLAERTEMSLGPPRNPGGPE